AVARHGALQQLTGGSRVAIAQLVQRSFVEDRGMLGIDSLDAHEQRVGTRTVTICQRLLSLRNQLADFAGCVRNAHRISRDRGSASLASVRGMIDNATALVVLL